MSTLPKRRPANDEVLSIPLRRLRRSISSPREHLDEAALDRLAHWIRRRGLLHPVLVRPADPGFFEVIAGERRVLAAERAGLEEVQCRVRLYPDPPDEKGPPGDVHALEDALVENLVRENLDPLEEAEAVLDLVCLHLGETRAFVLGRLAAMHARAGRVNNVVQADEDDDRVLAVFEALNLVTWRTFHMHRAPLLRLPPDVKALVHSRRVSYVLARRIARLEEADRAVLARRVGEGLRGRALREEVDRLLGGGEGPPRPSHSGLPERLEAIRRAVKQGPPPPRVGDLLSELERELGLA